MRNTRNVVGNRINNYICNELNIDDGDLDIRFKVCGHKYRIRQFTTLWTILYSIGVITAAFAVYIFFVGMIIIGDCIGGM